MHRFYAVALSLVAMPLVNCMMPPMMQQPGAQDPSGSSAAPELSGAGPSSSSSSFGAPQTKAAGNPPAPSAPIPTSVELHSDCSKTTPVFYGDKPKFGSGTKSSIGSNTTTSATRKADGTLTVWIIDEHENGLASVKVTPATKRVEIDSSCRQITAR